MLSALAALLFWSAVATCILVWLLPAALDSVSAAAQDAVNATAALILLPEFLLTSARRRQGRAPGRLAYGTGDVVAWCAGLVTYCIDKSLARGSRGLAALHPAAAFGASLAIVTGVVAVTS